MFLIASSGRGSGATDALGVTEQKSAMSPRPSVEPQKTSVAESAEAFGALELSTAGRYRFFL